MTPLDELFNQILVSEDAARTRKNRLNEVKEELKTLQTSLNKLYESQEILKGKHLLLLNQLSIKDVSLKTLTIAKGIVAEKQLQLSEECDNLSNDVHRLRKKLRSDQNAFCSKVVTFLREHEELQSDPGKQRHLKAEKEEQVSNAVRHEIVLEMVHKLRELKNVTVTLEAERTRSNGAQENLQSLQNEFEKLKTSHTEKTSRYNQLQQHLESLQRRYWQEEVKRQ